MSQIELKAVCSAQVKKNASMMINGDFVAWQVDPSLPFCDDSNFGKLCHMLNVFSPCELCHYYEGVVGDVIDIGRTPEELGYRPRMSVYVRMKKIPKAGEVISGEVLGVKLGPAEEKLLRRLRIDLIPNLSSDEPCPLCSRTEQQAQDAAAALLAARAQGLSTSMSFQQSGANYDTTTPAMGSNTAKYRPEVGIQCGNAGRMNEELMPVAFGTASRLREQRADALSGGPRDFQFTSEGRIVSHGFSDFDDALTDLKAQLDKVTRERDQFCLELREMTKIKVQLEQWKTQHRCEVSAEVSDLRKQHEALQSNLRDLMRGREEVFSLLHSRRSVGLSLQDTPRPYKPFAMSVPSLDTSPPTKDLLSKRLGDGSPASARGGSVEPLQQDRAEAPELLRRPSGVMGAAQKKEPPHAATQSAGQCLLRVNSSVGESFFVKRRMSSHIRDGKHVFILMSLDGVVTDEIHVTELESTGVEGATGLHLATNVHEWMLYMNAAERQQWVHWFYALNPYLSAKKPMPSDPVPNSY